MATKHHERAVRRAIAAAMRGAVSRYMTTRDVRLTDEEAAAIREAVMGVWRYDVERGGAAVIDGEKGCFVGLETKADDGRSLWELFVEEYLRLYGQASLDRIAETTRDQIIRLINKGISEGLGISAIAKAINQQIPSISTFRANLITRTEGHSAAQYGGLSVARRSARPMVKVWNSVSDPRTRDFGEGDGVADMFNHRVMDDVTADLDAPFMVPNRFGGVEQLLFPGDPTASAGNRINCRCALTYRRKR